MNTSNFIFIYLFIYSFIWPLYFPRHFSDFHLLAHTVLSFFGSSLYYFNTYCRFLEKNWYLRQFVFLFVSVCVFLHNTVSHIHMYFSLSFLILISPKYGFSLSLSLSLVPHWADGNLTCCLPDTSFSLFKVVLQSSFLKNLVADNYIKAVVMGNLFFKYLRWCFFKY